VNCADSYEEFYVLEITMGQSSDRVVNLPTGVARFEARKRLPPILKSVASYVLRKLQVGTGYKCTRLAGRADDIKLMGRSTEPLEEAFYCFSCSSEKSWFYA
jgi:hypothetical protein